MTDKDEQSTREKWLTAYDDMMMRVKTALEEVEESTLPVLQRYIHNARDTAVELEELTKEESEKIAYYLQRDLQDADWATGYVLILTRWKIACCPSCLWLPITPAWRYSSLNMTSRKVRRGMPAKSPAPAPWFVRTAVK